MAVAQVSTARVAASMAAAEREPWAAAVRRRRRPTPADGRRPAVEPAAPAVHRRGWTPSPPAPAVPAPARSRRRAASRREPRVRKDHRAPASRRRPTPAGRQPPRAPPAGEGHRGRARRRTAEAAAVAVPLTGPEPVAHLLVTNDFPPKVGGIQSYLWELWRRLPSDRVTVLTTPHPDAAAFDAAQPFAVHRWHEPGPAAHAGVGARDPPGRRPRPAPTWCFSTPPCPWACWAPAWACRTGWCCTAPR